MFFEMTERSCMGLCGFLGVASRLITLVSCTGCPKKLFDVTKKTV